MWRAIGEQNNSNKQKGVEGEQTKIANQLQQTIALQSKEGINKTREKNRKKTYRLNAKKQDKSSNKSTTKTNLQNHLIKKKDKTTTQVICCEGRTLF